MTATRRRGQRLDDAILDATWQVLQEAGYARLTFEAVAARAGTSRPVLNRRWLTRAELALAAMERAAPPVVAAPDTGSLRSDLVELLRQAVNGFGAVRGEVLAGLLAETARDPDATAAVRAWIARSTTGDTMAAILAGAAERGEIRTADVPARVLRLPFDLVRNEAIRYGLPVADDAIASIVDDVVLPLVGHTCGERPAAAPPPG
ncbi:TetR family transcriptional regulator [Nonomuraea sp. WAC 01424]|uniref:TetR/AcrR family transcriptional regulator n=1 Tax=Nonomuraea sp. WAC 01424 TaxID=2203200 RepID=UPI000F77D9DD|nr:TetR/AcrR family transcriptional regulator [Nonomuraea sp. WAC 01424]RSM95289.1 TetR family transcriptional regulator [Nonomuraea sp. WAC 01424]